jgi:hypothetical protein
VAISRAVSPRDRVAERCQARNGIHVSARGDRDWLVIEAQGDRR